VIAGRTVIVTADTHVEGAPAVGLQAAVDAVQHKNAVLHAIKITIKG
jgi:hypothetical protein